MEHCDIRDRTSGPHDILSSIAKGMTTMKTRHLLVAVMALASCSAVLHAADVALKVAAVNAIPVPGGPQSTIEVDAGDLLTAEIYLSNWAGDLLRGYQVQLDEASLTSGAAGSFSQVVSGSTIDTAHGDYIFNGLSSDPNDQVSFAVTDTSTSAFRWTAGVFDPGTSAADSGGEVYLATVMLQVSNDAAGTFNVSFGSGTLLRDDANPPGAITPINFTAAAITIDSGGSCTTLADCGDADNDGFRDDPCLHYRCVDSTCVEIVRGQGQSDMGGQFGACENDGTCDGNDRFLALGCFGNDWPGDPCEVSPPSAINVDAGGAFGACTLDGVCDGNDAFAALNCFGGDRSCACGGGPTPTTPSTVQVVGNTAVSLRTTAKRAAAGSLIAVDVYFDDAVADLRGYQLHLAPSGGTRGQLDLVDISIEPRKDAAFTADWQAFNKTTSQMVAGLDGPGQPTSGPAYLATFTYRSSRDAIGTFAIDLLYDDADPKQRTFLFPTPNRAKIAISDANTATIEIAAPARSSRDDAKR